MISNSFSSRIKYGVFWKFGERIGVQLIKFVIQIILARLLTPDDYGIIALLVVFINLADILVQSGFASSLIQKNDTDDVDYSTVFWAGFFLSILIYIILFFTAPIIAKFYNKEILCPVLRCLSITIFIISINSIQVAKLSKALSFKVIFWSNTGANLLSGIISIIAAKFGIGVWALVLQQLLGIIFYTLFLSLKVRFPINFFSIRKLKPLFSFGWKITIGNVIAILTENLYNLLTGKIYGTEITGYYSRGQLFPATISSGINQTTSSVLFPAMSEVQNDLEQVKILAKKTTNVATFVVFPAVIGLAIVSKNLVTVLLTERWLPCVPFLQLECLFYATLPMNYASGQAINATGHSHVSLILEAIKSLITLILMLVLYKFVNIYVIVGMRASISLILLGIQTIYTKNYFNYGLLERLIDLVPNTLITIGMAICVFFVGKINLPVILILLLQIVVGIISYIFFAWVFKNTNLMYVYHKINKNKKN